MSPAPIDTEFHGSIPELYERHLVPLIFTPYAELLAERIATLGATRILELAAGTGALTREIASRVGPAASITATDLSQSMIDQARKAVLPRPVEWRQADALRLPFADGAFDLVTCQFGVMFFPDRVCGYDEAFRVLRPDGTLLFAVWDSLETNEFIHTMMSTLAPRYGEGLIDFMRRTPHGYFDHDVIRNDLAAAGFREVRIDTVERRSVAARASDVATGYCQGTPMRIELESLGPEVLQEATRLATDALETRFGTGRIEGRIQALVVEARHGG